MSDFINNLFNALHKDDESLAIRYLDMIYGDKENQKTFEEEYILQFLNTLSKTHIAQAVIQHYACHHTKTVEELIGLIYLIVKDRVYTIPFFEQLLFHEVSLDMKSKILYLEPFNKTGLAEKFISRSSHYDENPYPLLKKLQLFDPLEKLQFSSLILHSTKMSSTDFFHSLYQDYPHETISAFVATINSSKNNAKLFNLAPLNKDFLSLYSEMNNEFKQFVHDNIDSVLNEKTASIKEDFIIFKNHIEKIDLMFSLQKDHIKAHHLNNKNKAAKI